MNIASPYPGPDTLCEACGYSLKGLSPDGGCPECGLAIEASSPSHRDGPTWHVHPGPRAAFEIATGVLLNPNGFFRRMRVDGTNVNARLFLLMTVTGIGLIWFAMAKLLFLLGGFVLPTALVEGMLIGSLLLVLSYIEALGVVYFSRRRGWRVPVKLAERVVCYSAIGWVPAVFVMAWVVLKVMDGSLDRWMQSLLGAWEAWQSMALLVLIAAVAMMGFEVLVWLGVRQVKYANS